jgi:hypothetical protein
MNAALGRSAGSHAAVALTIGAIGLATFTRHDFKFQNSLIFGTGQVGGGENHFLN